MGRPKAEGDGGASASPSFTPDVYHLPLDIFELSESLPSAQGAKLLQACARRFFLGDEGPRLPKEAAYAFAGVRGRIDLARKNATNGSKKGAAKGGSGGSSEKEVKSFLPKIPKEAKSFLQKNDLKTEVEKSGLPGVLRFQPSSDARPDRDRVRDRDIPPYPPYPIEPHSGPPPNPSPDGPDSIQWDAFRRKGERP